jgi:hypothetical protein
MKQFVTIKEKRVAAIVLFVALIAIERLSATGQKYFIALPGPAGDSRLSF